MHSVNIYGISAQTRLKLKLLSVVHQVSMSEMVTQLIETAYNEDKISIGKENRSKLKRIIKKWG